MNRKKRKPNARRPAPSPRPPLPLAIHEYLVEIEGRAKRLLEGCHTPGGGIASFDEVRAAEILRSYAVDALDKQAGYYEAQEAYSPQWLGEVVDQTVATTLDLMDPINKLYRALLQSQTSARLNPVDGIPESWPLRSTAEAWRRMLQVRIEERLDREPNRTEAAPAINETNGDLADRRAAVDAYIDEVFNQTGKRITRTDIWKSERYKTRTEFERWESRFYERKGRKPNSTAQKRFARILIEKPHLRK